MVAGAAASSYMIAEALQLSLAGQFVMCAGKMLAGQVTGSLVELLLGLPLCRCKPAA